MFFYWGYSLGDYLVGCSDNVIIVISFPFFFAYGASVVLAYAELTVYFLCLVFMEFEHPEKFAGWSPERLVHLASV